MTVACAGKGHTRRLAVSALAIIITQVEGRTTPDEADCVPFRVPIIMPCLLDSVAIEQGRVAASLGAGVTAGLIGHQA